ncbi:DNA-directed RNA polymerase III subunit RPC8 [Diabrotica virgifera virgifera]|uniref:DNA-directed RNA polymerase III subunit RPC8 n=1 Tax=Diabrotica virgifera virgifera TaxID=50390 RepID=A0A6P7GHX8_DIAVI|nr:DNA-directed RNA polymerase III subunit RPC8 [Diabrotica virgifera virgifera]
MFILAEMKNVTRIPPELFNMKLNDAIAGELNEKLANKVVLNVGLCIALYDIINLKESFIIPGDGASHTRVNFRFIVFRPFIEEILVGKIRSCSQEGVHVTLGFFEDIIIPPTALQHPSKFNETEQAWVWEYDTGDGSKHDLFMDAGETIRFRVTAEAFNETCPTGPTTIQDSQENTESKIPYMLTGSINEPGLGLLTWWDN